MDDKWKTLAAAFAIVVCAGSADAAEAPKASEKEDRGVVKKIEETAHNVGKRIEEGVTGTVKTFEEQRVGERLGETIKNAATKTGEELERVGKKIESTFSK